IVAKITDQFGNVLKNNSTISLSLDPGTVGTLTPGLVLNGTKSIKANNGVAVFDSLSVNQAGTVTLKATDGALTNSTTSFQVVISPVLPIMPKPQVAASYAVNHTFTLSTQMRGLVGSSAAWTGSASLVDSNSNVIPSSATVNANGTISLLVAGLTAGTYT